MTPTAGSGASRYKIPDDLEPSGICCISVPVPNDREYIAQFMGAIWRMSLQTHYERDAAHSAVTVAAIWRGIWEDLQVSGCCGVTINDITIDTQINVQMAAYLFELNQLYIAASGNIYTAWPETPLNYDTDPGDSGPEVAQRNRALCLAVESFVNETFNRALSFIFSLTDEVMGLVIAGVAVPFVPVYAVVGGLIGLGAIAAEVAQELARDAYRAYMVCAMFEALQGASTNSKAAFFGAADNLPARPPPPQSVFQDAARNTIETWFRSQLNNTENYLGFIKALNAAMGMALPLTDQACGCLAIEGVEIEITPSELYTVEPVLTKLAGERWNVVAGVIDHPSAGLSDSYQVRRVGGGCFTATNTVLVSGSMTRTSWQNCGGSPEFGTFGTPLNKPNVDYYSNSDPGQVDGLEVNLDALEP